MLNEQLVRFDVAVEAECEASIARIRVSLLGDAMTTKLFDDRITQYREAFKTGAYMGAKAWREIELLMESHE